MKSAAQHKITTPSLFTVALALLCFGLLPKTQAVIPAPDGGYPGGNTAEGQNALFSLTTGGFNTAVGFFSLRSNTTNSFNTAFGAGTLLANTADQNTATGAGALLSNTIGQRNTANGAFALFNNTEGNNNVANGASALLNNTTGTDNIAIGVAALQSNTEGSANTAIGFEALLFNTTANGNTAIGTTALNFNVTGFDNTAVGQNALFACTGNNNIGLGFGAGGQITTGNNNIDIGSAGTSSDAATIRIGLQQAKTFIAGIRGATTVNGNAIPVLIDSAGQLGTASSSRRFKNEIKPMDKASEAILALKPVTFHYNNDKTSTPQFGLIAEEVAEVNRDLVVRDNNGEIYTVRYDAVNAMLLNEFLKEHRRVQAQEATIARQRQDFQGTIDELKKEIASLTTTIQEQGAQIQKVSAQLTTASPSRGGIEMTKLAPRVACLPAVAPRLRGEGGNNP